MSRADSIKETMGLLRQNSIVLAGTLIAAVIVLIGLLAPLVINQSVISSINFGQKLLPPSSSHILGTDTLGRDLFKVMLVSTSYDLAAAAFILVISSVIGIVLGSAAGFLGGRADEVVMRVTDIFLAFPSLILAMAVAAVLGRTLLNLMLAVTIVWWSPICRLTRGQAIAEREKLYVDSLRVLGVSKTRIILRHMIPNSIFPVLVYITTQVGIVILTFAGLNYIGFGPGPLTPEWGQLIAQGQTYIFQDPTVAIFPGIAIFITSMAFNLLGDGLRDVFDPKLRN
ncbi:MAG: ABC transporter permease [Nitrososphaerota archaeon]|nr:ABC transporter permease [Nitrososphaerota archaeon]